MVINEISAQLGISTGLLVFLVVWELFWKGIALWKSVKLNHPVWFVLLLIFNTIGILPILYLILFSRHTIGAPKISKINKISLKSIKLVKKPIKKLKKKR